MYIIATLIKLYLHLARVAIEKLEYLSRWKSWVSERGLFI